MNDWAWWQGKLARPVADDLSLVANWLVIIVLFVPVGLCLVLLERANYSSWSQMLAVAGMVGAGSVSALCWERSRVLRWLPPIYGSALMGGSLLLDGTSNWPRLLEAAGGGFAVGLVMLFAIWVDR